MPFGANLAGANLGQAKLGGVRYNGMTIWPANFDQPKPTQFVRIKIG